MVATGISKSDKGERIMPFVAVLVGGSMLAFLIAKLKEQQSAPPPTVNLPK